MLQQKYQITQLMANSYHLLYQMDAVTQMGGIHHHYPLKKQCE